MFHRSSSARVVALLALCGAAVSVGATKPAPIAASMPSVIAADLPLTQDYVSYEYVHEDSSATPASSNERADRINTGTSRSAHSDRSITDDSEPDSEPRAIINSLPMLPEDFVLPSEREDEQLIPEISVDYSITDPESKWVIVNKAIAMDPLDFEPTDMRVPKISIMTDNDLLNDEAATALEELNAAVTAATGKSLVMLSAYRSYEYQVSLYNRFSRQFGQDHADAVSAQPGHSEHQTGWAVDVGQKGNSCITQVCFGDTATGQWIAAHAWKHGFIIRYPLGETDVTGFSYEPWHLRYVGEELAAHMHQEDIATLEEAFKVGPAPDYLAAD